MSDKISIISPVDGSIIAERTLATEKEIVKIVVSSRSALTEWRKLALTKKAEICNNAIDNLVKISDELAQEITWQMGRPIKFSSGEIRGLEERGRYMIDIAEQSLSDLVIEDKNTKRFIRRVPLGTVLTIAPWNYPYLTAINSIIPALMAGNTVILKPSKQTFLCTERLQQAFDQAGLPHGVFQFVYLDHKQTADLIQNSDIDFVSFTGSISGGQKIEQTAAGLFKGTALELGGKDPAYVRQDANLDLAVNDIVDGAFFNSGQSCCAIERIYVHESIYEKFIDLFIHTVSQYRLGNPLDPETTLGPMVNADSAQRVREQIKQACEAGAKKCIDSNLFPADKYGSPYLAPQVLLNVDHSMAVMQDESFGPVIGIMKVKDDQEAISLMNDSRYGLTASIWCDDHKIAEEIGNELNTGTVFMNRCDYLDPALAWSGVKQSGRGCALSTLGYQQLTRAKSFHLKHDS